MTEPCMSNDSGHYQGSYSERKECGVIGAYTVNTKPNDGMKNAKRWESLLNALLYFYSQTPHFIQYPLGSDSI